MPHLSKYTSGLGYGLLEPGDDSFRRLGLDQGFAGGGMTLEESLRRLAAAPLQFEPGPTWRYSLSADMLDAEIEKAAGAPLPEAVARRVTGPLVMRDTAFVVEDPGRHAATYRDGEDRAVRMRDDADFVPLGEGVPVPPSRLLGAHAVGDLRARTEGEGWVFGLGAAVLLDPAAAATPQSPGAWQWGGALGGHWFVDPARRLTVVVLTNTSVAGVIGAFPQEICDAIYGECEG